MTAMPAAYATALTATLQPDIAAATAPLATRAQVRALQLLMIEQGEKLERLCAALLAPKAQKAAVPSSSKAALKRAPKPALKRAPKAALTRATQGTKHTTLFVVETILGHRVEADGTWQFFTKCKNFEPDWECVGAPSRPTTPAPPD
jgi:hypothetical protein